jgi:phage gp29-like protein
MPKKIWISEHESIDIEGDALEGEFAPRSRSIDFFGMWSYLPDPDPVLEKLGETMRVYRELLTDSHVWSCYESRTAGTLSKEWGLVQPDRGEVSEKIMDACEEMLDGLDVTQILTDALETPWFGMAPLEVTWRRDGRMWIPAAVTGKPQEWFAFDAENQPVFLSIDNPMGEPIPPLKFIIPRHHASYRNPYGERVLSRCFWPVTFKKGGWKFWTVFCEKFGMPFITGKVPRGTKTADREHLLSNLAAMVQDAVAVINDDESVDLTEAAGKSSSAGVYSGLIDAANREVSKASLGQNLSTELTQGGSYAATSSHMEVRGDIVDKDKRPCRTAMNTLLSWFVAINHP